jgi:SAM-dependent methyltransferase
MANNQDQIDYWNGPVGERWVKYQDDMDRAIGPFGDAALERLPLGAGARVLDVGCGAGASTVAIMARIAPSGTVVGVDVSRPLIARARERVSQRAVELGVTADFALGDAATYRAEMPFDALFSRFGVMFFEEPVRAFSNLRATLAPGGHLAFVCWRSLADNPWCGVPLAAARRIVPPPATGPDPRAPGPFAFAEPEYVSEILRQGGFDEIALTPFTTPVVLSTVGLDGAVDQALRLGPTSRLLIDQADEVVARVRDEVRRELTPLVEGREVRLLGGAWIVTARAPRSAEPPASPPEALP